jgi:TatD DNase family protein
LPLLSDTHCHIDLESFAVDRQAMLERAWQAGIRRILVPGLDIVSSRRAIALAERDARIFAAVGVHPNNGQDCNDASMAELRDLAGHPRVCAIGEIGLDFYRDHTTPVFQRNILLNQLALAAELDKPVILHCRDAFDDLIKILHNWQAGLPDKAIHIRQNPGVFHSFSGDRSQASEVVSSGFRLGINGSITFKNAIQTREMVKCVDPTCFLLETDAPYITPVPNRGQRNEPAFIRHTNQKLAECLSLSAEQCAKMTYNSACNLFNW